MDTRSIPTGVWPVLRGVGIDPFGTDHRSVFLSHLSPIVGTILVIVRGFGDDPFPLPGPPHSMGQARVSALGWPHPLSGLLEGDAS